MNEEQNRLLREKSLSFFGTVTASLSHEISNSMAIISEVAGLMQDVLPNTKRKARVDTEKLRELSQRITNQVKKGQDIVKVLNRLAHTTDEPVSSFKLEALLTETVSLAERFAFLRRVELETDFPDESLTISSDAFRLHQAVFAGIQLTLGASQKGDVITVGFDKANSGARITVSSPRGERAEDFDSGMTYLCTLAESFGGKAEAVSLEAGGESLAIYVPESIDH
jgi:signal transduction histidine kinase